MKQELVTISKTISYALRHNPDEFQLILDEMGWVLVDELLNAIRSKSEHWNWVNEETLYEILKESDKQRFEIKDSSIRAMYGHTLPAQRIQFTPTQPPEVLYHGTTQDAATIIMKQGLEPMQRQYVHLSADKKTAVIVGKRRCRQPVILLIDAKTAFEQDIKFYHGNEKIWLANFVPSKYISN